MKTKLFYLVAAMLVISAFVPAHAQSVMQKAQQNFDEYNYFIAAKYYKRAHIRNKEDVTIIEQIADCYRLMNNRKEAELWYAKATSMEDYDPKDILEYAECLVVNNKYNEAAMQYDLFAEKFPSQKNMAYSKSLQCRNALDWQKNPVNAEVYNLTKINTKYADFSPMIYKDKIYFASDRKNARNFRIFGWTGNSFLKVFTTEIRNNKDLKSPKMLNRRINKKFHNGPYIISYNGKVRVITRINYSNKFRLFKNTDETDDQIYHSELFYSICKDGRWGTLIPFPYNNGQLYSLAHPALSADGNTIYFASDMPGSIGESDIFYSELMSDSTWTTPVNCGSQVNTKNKESFPSTDIFGNLYFSSNGRGGMGALDIFKAIGEKSGWTSVINLRAPINSSSDDFGITYDTTGMAGYFSSDREGGKGGDDIYSFQLNEPVFELSNIRIPILVSQLLAVNSSNAILYNYDISRDNYKTFKDSLIAIARANDSWQMAIKSMKNVPVADFMNPKLEVGNTFRLENIYFDFAKADLTKDSERGLLRLFELLQKNPKIKIQIAGNTDSLGSKEYNKNLSLLRAESVADFLKMNGVEANRIKYVGYGDEQPIATNLTDFGRQANRRTEFTIIENNNDTAQNELEK